MLKKITIAASMLVVVGCASQNGVNNPRAKCQELVERDLTVMYDDRSYWCAPKEYIRNLPPKTIKKPEPDENFGFFEVKPEPVTTYANVVNFQFHDYKYDRNDIIAVSQIGGPISLRGCRLASEPKQLVLGRSLRVKQEIQKLGFKHKVTILNDQSCIGQQIVEVK